MIKYANLFEPVKIGSLEIKNRWVMAPMANFGMTDPDGTFNERGANYFVERAKGGVGLLITGASPCDLNLENMVRPSVASARETPSAFIKTSAVMSERIHAYGAKIFLQISSGSGRIGQPHIFRERVSASEVRNRWRPELLHRPLTLEEIKKLIACYGESCAIAQKSGYDGIEIHAVHEGYMLDQFALSVFNKRTDEYGGSLENRLRLATEFIYAAKEACGDDYPIALRYAFKSFMKDIGKGALPGEDFVEMGRDYDEGIEAAKILVKAGVDALDVDCGVADAWYWNHPPMYFEKGMYLPYVKLLKKHLDVPIITAGRMDDPEIATKAVADGITDMVSLGRPLLADPYIVNKIRLNQLSTIRPCLSCHDGCLGKIGKGQNVSCAVNPAAGREVIYGLTPADRKKTVVVVGGGPGGMEFARVAAVRGHQVTLLEQNNQLGGNLIPASQPSFKCDDRALINWYQQELEHLGVDVQLNIQANADNIQHLHPDVIAVVTGSTPITVPIPGVEQAFVYKGEDILLHPEKAGDKVTIIGGGLVGSEIAYFLSLQGKKVTVIEATPYIIGTPGHDGRVPFPNREMLIDLLAYHRVKIMTSSTVKVIGEQEVLVTTANGDQKIAADTVIIAVGYKSNKNLYSTLGEAADEVYLLGDAQKVDSIMSAIWSAYEIARGI